MRTYNKTIELNGKLVKVKVGFYYHTIERTTNYQVWSVPVSIFINEICYDKVVNISSDESKRNSGLKFTCNKTGRRFNDSEKKVVEHILNLYK
jgi:hypothetical protein